MIVFQREKVEEMSDDRTLKKEDIKPSDIKANIYDSVEIVVDIYGVTEHNIEDTLEKLIEILPAQKYRRTDDSLTVEEINAYGDRKDIPLTHSLRRRYLEKEGVVRYYSKKDSEKITICGLFISISLSYEIAHILKDNIELMHKIIEIFKKLEYFEVERISLIKKDSIYCSSLDDLYQCFNEKMFSDAGYALGYKAGETDCGVTKVYNNFSYKETDIILNKQIMAGQLADSDEIVYEGKMETIVSRGLFEDLINVKEILSELNDISFEIFMNHITDDFAADLVAGKSSKVKAGVK